MQGNLLLLVISDWSETAQDLTHVDSIRLEHLYDGQGSSVSGLTYSDWHAQLESGSDLDASLML